jgi:hypothetical protein
MEMNRNLLKVFTSIEVDMPFKQMHPLKSPGLDGMSAYFYQHSWMTVCNEVCLAMFDFLNNGGFDPAINDTFITLIPKFKTPTCIMKYKPISLCNVIYKVIAKVLANRLKKVLPHIISSNQRTFIPGRLIIDNILVAFEALHTMVARIKGKKGYMALKLDMSKAYDRVKCDFLEAMMTKIGFAGRRVEMVMTCVCTVLYSILINGHPYGKIISTRGIRQGDPLFPYFFIFYAESLSIVMNKVEKKGIVTGLPIARGGTKINHTYEGLLLIEGGCSSYSNLHYKCVSFAKNTLQGNKLDDC